MPSSPPSSASNKCSNCPVLCAAIYRSSNSLCSNPIYKKTASRPAATRPAAVAWLALYMPPPSSCRMLLTSHLSLLTFVNLTTPSNCRKSIVTSCVRSSSAKLLHGLWVLSTTKRLTKSTSSVPPSLPCIVLLLNSRYVPEGIPHTTVVKGDATYMSIAAASILAKTYRDDFMLKIHEEYPQYHWDSNKGYPAPIHREAIRQYGTTPYHRLTFQLLPPTQLELPF